MKRVALSFGISLAIVGLLMVAIRASLLASVLVSPGLVLSSHLIPKGALPTLVSDFPPTFTGGSLPWMYFYVVSGIFIDGLLYTWPVLFLSRVGARIISR
jgi:hypothetical protein